MQRRAFKQRIPIMIMGRRVVQIRRDKVLRCKHTYLHRVLRASFDIHRRSCCAGAVRKRVEDFLLLFATAHTHTHGQCIQLYAHKQTQTVCKPIIFSYLLTTLLKRSWQLYVIQTPLINADNNNESCVGCVSTTLEDDDDDDDAKVNLSILMCLHDSMQTSSCTQDSFCYFVERLTLELF